MNIYLFTDMTRFNGGLQICYDHKRQYSPMVGDEGNGLRTLAQIGVSRLMECYLPANLFSPVQQLTVRLFPLQEGTDFRADLYRSIITYATIRLAKGVTYQEVRTEIIELAAKISPALEEKIVQLFASEFSEVLKNRVVKEKASSTPKPLDHKIKQLSLSSQSDAVHPKYSFFSQRAPTVWKLDTVSQTFQSTQQSNSTRAIADQYISEYSHTADLSHESCCLCGQTCVSLSCRPQGTFKCIHCERRYHRQCMQRRRNCKQCSQCHLQKLIPTRKVIKTLFVGLLPKGRRKHEVRFDTKEEDLQVASRRVQIRCFRLKENCQQAILFPDSAVFTLNNCFLKEFEPINKQSCLKYRKDQPFFVLPSLVYRLNRLTIDQKPCESKNKYRCEPENHLLGIYLVEQRKIEAILQQTITEHTLQFGESERKLLACFDAQEKQVSCEIVKIPLVCGLTRENLKYPARGSFCTHYQCFDLHNVLTFIENSDNPRWNCPICKEPIYHFEIDCILLAILQLNFPANEVMFSSKGEYTLFKDNEIIADSKSTVYMLDIPKDWKRQREEEEDVDKQKTKRIKFTMPHSTPIIEID